MFNSAKKGFGHNFENLNGLLFLLALLLFLIIPIPITFYPSHYGLIFAISYSLIIILGTWSVSRKRRDFYLGIVFGLISFVMIWTTLFSRISPQLELIRALSLLFFFGFLAFQLFKTIALNGEININIIYASISGYLLIGLIGGNLFQLLEITLPGSFYNVNGQDILFDLHYFSFVTLTTLGFGDITPASEAAKSLTMVISLSGQLYLTILIAILVGKYLSTKH